MSKSNSITYGKADEPGAVTFKLNEEHRRIEVRPEGDYEGEDSFYLRPAQIRALARRLITLADKCEKLKKR